MKQFFYRLFLSILLLIALPNSALALGDGGGGSQPAPTTSSKPTGNWLINSALDRPHKLYCTQKKMIDRIRCRLSMSAEELAQENSIQYLPEECRALAKKNQPACIYRYKKVQECWEKAAGPDRAACAADILGVPTDIGTAVAECSEKNPSQKKICLAQLREKVYSLVKFRLYDLSERAEDTRQAGSDINPVVVLVNAMETNKQLFNKATTAAGRVAAVNKARAAWKTFVKTVPSIDADDYLDAGLADLQLVK